MVRTGDRIGIVGANGTGKSSLLAVLAGLARPAAGVVRRAPGTAVGFLGQSPPEGSSVSIWRVASRNLERLRDLERQIRLAELGLAQGATDLAEYGRLLDEFEGRGGYRAETLLRESLARLGFPEARLKEPLNSLSEGESRRVALAAAVAGEPELLLLDEPTNHLDLPTISWLERRLVGWRGGIVLVSHDRALLDSVCTGVLEIAHGTVRQFRGNYEKYRLQRGVLARQAGSQARERRKRVEQLERTAEELRAWGNAASQVRRKRMERELARLRPNEERREPRVRGVASAGSAARSAGTRGARGELLWVRDLTVRRGDLDLFVPTATVAPRERVAILGANGSGKSTLLEALVGKEEHHGGQLTWHPDAKLFHADQRWHGLLPGEPVWRQLTRLVSESRARLLLSLAGLPGDIWFRSPFELSGGQLARVGLARLLADNANVLLLDEPGNDLDLEALETLHGALEATEAAVLLVTHDRALARSCQRVWSISDGRLIEFRGGIDGYLAGRRRLEDGLSFRHEVWPVTTSLEPDDESSAREAADRAGTVGDEQGGHIERLELDLLGLEERLEDPLSLSDRELQRIKSSIRATLDELSLALEAAQPPPAPRFTASEQGVRLEADLSEEGLAFRTDLPVSMRTIRRGDIVHLVLAVEEGHCLLEWVRSALVTAAVRLVFYALAPKAVQYFDPGLPPGQLLLDSGDGWWSLDRERFERQEGWLVATSSTGPGGGRTSRGMRPRKRRLANR